MPIYTKNCATNWWEEQEWKLKSKDTVNSVLLILQTSGIRN